MSTIIGEVHLIYVLNNDLIVSSILHKERTLFVRHVGMIPSGKSAGKNTHFCKYAMDVKSLPARRGSRNRFAQRALAFTTEKKNTFYGECHFSRTPPRYKNVPWRVLELSVAVPRFETIKI